MLDLLLIKHCAPTLAALKSGSLFTYQYGNDSDFRKQLIYWNEILNPKGVHVVDLRKANDRVLIYVYRPSKLGKDINQSGTMDFLSFYGYRNLNPEHCIERLTQRFSVENKFPHEIGLFLGYPLEDVKGFIENKGRNFKYLGCWKVYDNEFEAMKIFAKYERCRQTYFRLFQAGMSIVQLTV